MSGTIRALVVLAALACVLTAGACSKRKMRTSVVLDADAPVELDLTDTVARRMTLKNAGPGLVLVRVDGADEPLVLERGDRARLDLDGRALLEMKTRDPARAVVTYTLRR